MALQASRNKTRTQEKLLQSDKGIMMARRKMLKALKAMQEGDELPPGVDPEAHKVRSASVILQENQAYHEAAQADLWASPGKPHRSV